METFDSIWQSSRINSWANFYPATIVLGIVALIALSFLKNKLVRRLLMVIATLMFTYFAIDVSFHSISEKWKIRGEWTSQNWDTMTERQQEIAMTDGANLLLGPPIYGLIAFFCFVVTVVCLSIARRLGINRKRNAPTGEA